VHILSASMSCAHKVTAPSDSTAPSLSGGITGRGMSPISRRKAHTPEQPCASGCICVKCQGSIVEV
jgi:hypothetical protein